MPKEFGFGQWYLLEGESVTGVNRDTDEPFTVRGPKNVRLHEFGSFLEQGVTWYQFALQFGHEGRQVFLDFVTHSNSFPEAVNKS